MVVYKYRFKQHIEVTIAKAKMLTFFSLKLINLLDICESESLLLLVIGFVVLVVVVVALISSLSLLCFVCLIVFALSSLLLCNCLATLKERS